MIKLNVDCLSLIFNELQTDKKSLHSCILVNKEWCHLVVPILWKKCSLFHNYNESEKKLFNTILSCLPSYSKQLLFDNDIKLPSTIILKPLLFNYISFCKFLDAEIVNKIIKMVFEEDFNIRKYDKKNLLEQEIYKLFVSQCNNIKELSWQTSQPLLLFPGASICFSQLRSLSIHIDFVKSNDLYEMAQICKNLDTLTIYDCSQDIPGLISLIDAQKNLKSVSLYPYIRKGTCIELSKALARKGNTIYELSLGSVNIIPPSFLTSLINLKNVSIYNGYEYEDIEEEVEEFQQYLAITELTKLQSLYVEDLSCFKELSMLIEKTKGNISQIIVIININKKIAKNAGMLIKTIANNCPNIIRLSTYIEPKDFIYVTLLLQNCRNLILLELDSLYNLLNENYYHGNELLDILTKFSSKSLINISISGDWNYSIYAIELFFESCRERNLLYFGITHNHYITENHIVVIKKYINEGVIKEVNISTTTIPTY